MAYDDRTDSGGSDLLTTIIVGLLTLTAVGGIVFCLGYAIWWLLTFWAPF